MTEPNEACLPIGYGTPATWSPEEPPPGLPPDLRPWWRKLTNVAILIVAVAGLLTPALLGLGYAKAAGVTGAVAAVGVALGLTGAARRADRIRSALAPAPPDTGD